ncbi:MAG: DUF5916 domain-containing protein [Gemmatimonadota bacterium]
MDGVLDEAAWDGALRLTLPHQWFPTDGVPAPVDTECYLTYDSTRLYIGCRAFDPDPSAIRAHLADRDTPFQDDYVLFLLDTFNDQRRAFEFRVNPYGVQMDALLGSGFEDFSWDEIWDSKGRITPRGYVVEVAIPFKSLSFPERASGPQTWGVIVGRSYPRNVRHRVQNIEQDLSNSCLLCQADKVTGFVGITAGRDIEINPTLTSTRTDRREDLSADHLSTGTADFEPGLTARWGVTTNLSLDATANPDFSQVEADVAQLETNRRFALFFPEKRPFFLEGADLFQTPMRLVFTRTVVDPQGGIKLSGKAGHSALGLFLTRDDANSLVFPANQGSSGVLLGDHVTAAVGRYRRDIGASSSIGGLVTVRSAGGYHNLVGSVDGDLRLNRSTSVTFQYVHSDTRYPDSIGSRFGQNVGSFGGNAVQLSLRHISRDWFTILNLTDLGKEFRADAGFLPRVDVRGGSLNVGRTLRGRPGTWFSQLRFSAAGLYQEDHDGQPTDRLAGVAVTYQGPLQSFLSGSVTWRDQFFAGELFGQRMQSLAVGLQPSGSLSLSASGSFGDQIDFANARRADVHRIAPSLTWKPGGRVNVGLSHAYERLSLEGRKIFAVNLAQARVLYHVSLEAFFRAIVQFRDVSRDPAMFSFPVEESTRTVFTQLLFSYKLNPRTVAFAGYSDNRLGLTDVSLTQTDRTFFVKLGYAFRP